MDYPDYIILCIILYYVLSHPGGHQDYGFFYQVFHVLIEIYPLVPSPPSLGEGFSDYTRTSLDLRWGPVTSARTIYMHEG